MSRRGWCVATTPAFSPRRSAASLAHRHALESAAEVTVVVAARAGDSDAFAELVRRRQSWLRNLMRRSCGDATLADDLAQQAFLVAWRRLGQLREPGAFGAWLRRIALNAVLQHVRANDPVWDATEPDETLAAPSSTPGGLALDLDRALTTLAPPVRLCVVLSYHEGMTHDEIADHLALPVGTVKSHVRRGSARLRELLAPYGDASSTENTT